MKTCPLLATYRSELLDNVIPFWERHGIDEQYGGYYTCLDRDGSLYSGEKYMWLQCRAVWMFARLHRQMESDGRWAELALRGADFVQRHGRDKDTGRVYFKLSRQGEPLHIQRKIYSEVFYQLAMTEMARLTGRQQYLDEAREVFDLILAMWRNPEMLGRPFANSQVSTLADPMVFLAMIEELEPLDNDNRYDAVADEMVEVALRHVKADRKLVLENVGRDGAILPGPDGRLTSPGHAVEMGWFLLHLAARRGDDRLKAMGLDIIEWSFNRGWDEQYGGLYYFMDADGLPSTKLEWNMKLWWPMTEAIYGLLLAWDLSGDGKFLEMHSRAHDWSWSHFRDADHGEWFGYLDRRGEPTHTLKGGQWKGFFHLPRALLYSIQLLERRAATEQQAK